jgi:hypothetical protein
MFSRYIKHFPLPREPLDLIGIVTHALSQSKNNGRMACWLWDSHSAEADE